MKCRGVLIVGLLLTVVLEAGGQENVRSARDRALVERVARSMELHSLYLGEWPASLEDLVRRPGKAKFWPEGGFWFGPLPEGVRWVNGAIACNEASVETRR